MTNAEAEWGGVMEKELTTKEKVKNTLEDYRNIKKRKLAADEELMAIRVDMLDPLRSIKNDITGIHGSGTSDTVEKCIEELITLESKYLDEITDMVSQIKKIEELVEFLPKTSNERTLIRQKYICCKSRWKVMQMLGYEKTMYYEILDNALAIIVKEIESRGIEL